MAGPGELAMPSLFARALFTTPPFVKLWNASIVRNTRPSLSGNLTEDIKAIIRQSEKRTAISDHLLTLYAEAIEVKPKVMVELGTEHGDSTRILAKVAEHWSGTLVSVDIEDCSDAVHSDRWLFVRSDDVEFGRYWPDWALAHGLQATIDFLFIDTSHLYDHTGAEMRVWFPYLGPQAKAVFHDTNLSAFFRRRDGSIGIGWDNQRGVIRAIEEYLGVRIDERLAFCGVVRGWLIRHDPICNGLTVLRRLT
jgi:hypothetical protein